MLPAIEGISKSILTASQGTSLLNKVKGFATNDNYGKRHDNDNDKGYKRYSNDNEKDGKRHDNDNDTGYKRPSTSIPSLNLSYSYSIPSIEKKDLTRKDNDNSEKLLDTVITLLYSINSKLLEQARLDAYRARVDYISKRETELEKIKKELNQTQSDNKPYRKSESTMLSTNSLMTIGGLAGIAGLLGVGGLDLKTLDKLGNKISEFQKKYSWIVEVATGVATGSLIGSIVPGVGTFSGAIVGGILATINHYFPLLSTIKETPYPELEGSGKDNSWYSGIFDLRYETPDQKARNDKKLEQYHKDRMKGFVPSPGMLGALGVGTIKDNSSSNSRQDMAYEFFKQKGWSDEQSAGIVGNLLQENSTLDPNKKNGLGAHGIAQWLSKDRKDNFKKSIGKGTKSIEQSTFEEQLQFIDWELRNTESKAGNSLKEANSVEAATMVVRKEYERPGDYEAMDNKRLSYAQSVYKGEQSTDTSSNIESGEYAADSKPNNSFASIIESFKTLPNTDNDYLGSMEEITKRNKIDQLKKMSMEEEDRLNFGEKNNNIQEISLPNTPESNIKKINGGTLDVINPNYNLSEYSILSSYLNFFSLSNKTMMI